ncbi:unnamed protein product [Caenorhabditis sp. 36 PRJEB53466]|nr:unnamed protein product [Caenorhabditis sp. 36 PRJEB53466]
MFAFQELDASSQFMKIPDASRLALINYPCSRPSNKELVNEYAVALDITEGVTLKGAPGSACPADRHNERGLFEIVEIVKASAKSLLKMRLFLLVFAVWLVMVNGAYEKTPEECERSANEDRQKYGREHGIEMTQVKFDFELFEKYRQTIPQCPHKTDLDSSFVAMPPAEEEEEEEEKEKKFADFSPGCPQATKVACIWGRCDGDQFRDDGCQGDTLVVVFSD